jgi:hypothetical protein
MPRVLSQKTLLDLHAALIKEQRKHLLHGHVQSIP